MIIVIKARKNMELLIVKELINKLNENNIDYCHWKSNQHVKYIFTGIDDIDMLISQKHINKLNIILNELNFKRFTLPKKRSYIGIEDYLGFDKSSGKFTHLHLHYKLTLGEKFLKGYQLPFGQYLIDNRIFDEENKIYISSHEDELWLLLIRQAMKLRHRDYIKLLLGKDIFGISSNNELKWLISNVDEKIFINKINFLFSDEIVQQLSKMIDNKFDFFQERKLQSILKKELKCYRNYSTIKTVLIRWSREWFRVCQEFHNRIYFGAKCYRRQSIVGGKIISFIGPDGAGKTSVLREVTKRYKAVLDVNNIYLGSGDGSSSLLRKPLKIMYSFFLKNGILNRNSKEISADGKISRYREGKKAFIIRKIGEYPWIYVLAKERKKKIKKVSKFRNRGYLVLTDRFPQTQIIDYCDGPKYYLNEEKKNNIRTRLIAKYEKRCFVLANLVKPDAIIIFNVSSEIAYNRKPDEIKIESHKELMNKILQLDFGKYTNRYIVDANNTFEEVVHDCMDIIWENL